MKKFLVNTFKILGVLVLVAVIGYFLGPKPKQPRYPAYSWQFPADLTALESEIHSTEMQEPGIKPGCEAKIVWADSSRKEKTKVAMIYLHGFGASREEGAPVHTSLAQSFGCNIFLARMDEHGVEEGDGNFCELTADSYVESAERALAIAQQLGDSVVILSTSGGAALGLFLASRHPEVKAVVTWSPCIRLFSGLSPVMAGPWGVHIARSVRGSKHNDWPFRKPEMTKYWTNHQCLEGAVHFATFLETAMVPATFAQIKCPVFVGYYYRDEENQDKVVSVKAMQEMYAALGTPAELKREMAFPNANDHVITSRIVSSDWEGVLRESASFIRDVVHLK